MSCLDDSDDHLRWLASKFRLYGYYQFRLCNTGALLVETSALTILSLKGGFNKLIIAD